MKEVLWVVALILVVAAIIIGAGFGIVAGVKHFSGVEEHTTPVWSIYEDQHAICYISSERTGLSCIPKR